LRKVWASQLMKQKDFNEGMIVLTTELVKDSMGFQGTRHFSAEQKKELTTYLLQNETYMAIARKHFEPLADKKIK